MLLVLALLSITSVAFPTFMDKYESFWFDVAGKHVGKVVCLNLCFETKRTALIAWQDIDTMILEVGADGIYGQFLSHLLDPWRLISVGFWWKTNLFPFAGKSELIT